MKCLITGAAGGIGSAIARLLCSEGQTLHLVDSSQDKLPELARELRSPFSLCDLTQTDTIHNLLSERDLPDTVINAVGKGYWGSFQSIPETYFEKSFDVNFFAPLFLGLAAIKRWRENGIRGKLLTLSSVSGHRVYGPSLIAYAAAKHALELGMRILECEGRKYGIKVGTICPADVNTGFWDNREMIENTSLPNRQNMLKAEDVALHTYHWLQSPNPPFNVFLPKERKFDKTMYGKEVRHVTQSRLHKLAEAGHTFPPQAGVAIVSGASSGLGKEITKRLSKNNWNVIAVARSADRLQALQNETANHNIEIMTGDVSDKHRIREVVRGVISRHGKIDLIVNNAGSAIMGPCLDLTLEDIKRVFSVNFYGYYHLTKESLDYLKESKGTILNVESITAFTVFPITLPYSCTKIAQTAVSETLKDELLPYGIRVVDIFPGNIRTDFFRHAESTDGKVQPVPGNAMPVVSVGEAVMQLLHGRHFTLTIPKSHLSVYSYLSVYSMNEVTPVLTGHSCC